MEKDMQELRREVQETRNLVVKSDALIKAMQADLRTATEKLRQGDRQRTLSSVTAYFLFAALAVLGAYLSARGELRLKAGELERARAEAVEAREALDEMKAEKAAAAQESTHAVELYERMNGPAGDKRTKALTEVAQLKETHLSAFEQKVLRERAATLSATASAEALEEGRSALFRRDNRAANEALTRYFALAGPKPEEVAYLYQGQARVGLKEFAGAVEPLQLFLRGSPPARLGDQATFLLADALVETGDKARAATVLRTNADRYYTSPMAGAMRLRARKLEQEAREGAAAVTP